MIKQHSHGPQDITEQTQVKVKVTTAWGTIASVVGMTIWLTAFLLKIYHENQTEHIKLLSEITALNLKSAEWVTRDQLEETLVYVIDEAHKGMTNMHIREVELRQGIRRTLYSPKTTP